MNYKDYVTEWDFLYNTFSKGAVLRGSFDIYGKKTQKKRGTTEVDDEFLIEIENWRELFAKNIALRNPETHRRRIELFSPTNNRQNYIP